MSRGFVGKTFPEAVMPTPEGDGVGVEKVNGVEVRDAGAAGRRTGNEYLGVNEVTFVKLEGAPGHDDRVSLEGSDVYTSPTLRKGLIL